ncbi:YbaK/EbsC family protein [Chryseobacterium sp. PTM-20240506]|uniref:YbaK/EbsC family protein n=1 Tax=unclassified Chryseobacterium TaxID=2593645 RepID=UPI0023580FCB|nr:MULTISPECIES: YbaK/EbsC family protein [unclassified Chryseobacterium]MDC8106105.1 YbaK/EbsC family protein [Chryseobacterium sp. B21-037]MDQ1804609.1 YbaK/EbsC family protein [Chryseobacterium sp. CKR4-1]
MGIEKAKLHLKKWNKDSEVIIFDTSSATVELAAAALNISGNKIAKSISLYDENNDVILIVAAGYRKIDNRKFKDEFGLKAKMLAFEDVEPLVGHPVGGVCPFGVNSQVSVFLDISLKEFEFVYPACGSANSAIKLSISELEVLSGFKKWVDVTKGG